MVLTGELNVDGWIAVVFSHEVETCQVLKLMLLRLSKYPDTKTQKDIIQELIFAVSEECVFAAVA